MTDIWSQLQAPWPASCVQSDPRGYKYVGWNTIAGRLDRLLTPGGWTTHLDVKAAELSVTATLTLRPPGSESFWITRMEASGIELPRASKRDGGAILPPGHPGWENAVKAAVTDALKRCAAHGFGIGRELYDEPVEQVKPVSTQKSEPAATSSNVDDPAPSGQELKAAISFVMGCKPQHFDMALKRAVAKWGDGSNEVGAIISAINERGE